MQRAITKQRDQVQSRRLVKSVSALLAIVLFLLVSQTHPMRPSPLWPASFVSLTFGLAVWALRAATPAAALAGAAVCLVVTGGNMLHGQSLLRSGLLPLMALFVLTFAAGRLGRRAKQARHIADQDAVTEKHGRRASQILSNLGAAALAIGVGLAPSHQATNYAPLMMLAVLAEATADTASSEIGSAFGGAPWMLTTLRRVPAGTDGAVSLAGTLAGILGAILVVVTGWWALALPATAAAAALAGSIAGLLFDSLLGATLEQQGWLGNDLVNFLSTLFAALCALALAALTAS